MVSDDLGTHCVWGDTSSLGTGTKLFLTVHMPEWGPFCHPCGCMCELEEVAQNFILSLSTLVFSLPQPWLSFPLFLTVISS